MAEKIDLVLRRSQFRVRKRSADPVWFCDERQQEHLVHLASFMPFDKAAEMVGVILSVQTNEETARQRDLCAWERAWKLRKQQKSIPLVRKKQKTGQYRNVASLVLMGQWFLWFTNCWRRSTHTRHW